MILRELRRLVGKGESERLEFKKTTGLKVEGARTVCAFLNGAGGRVLFGVTNSGNIAGQDVADQTLQDLAAEFRRLDPPHVPQVSTVRLPNGRAVIVVEVPPGGSKPYAYDGRPYLRSGPTTSLMSQHLYHRLLREREHAAHRWESEPVAKDIAIKDLDAEEIRRAVDNAVAAGRLERPRRRGVENLLRGFGLIRDGRLINAAIVLFGQADGLKLDYPQLSLRLGRFRGTDRLADVSDNRQYWGHAFELLHRAEEFLLDHVPIAGRVVSGKMRRQDRPAYPPRATREALANALCHRDYADRGGAVTVALYDDRLEIVNPDGFHLGVTPEQLARPHESRPWNPILADVFYRTEIIERFGTGTLNILDWCRKNGNPPPEWKDQSGAVVTIFKPAKPIQSGGQESRQESGLESRQESLPERILALLKKGPLSRSQIARALGHKRVSGAVNRAIRSLLEGRNIEYTIPQKPQSRMQKYRLKNLRTAAKKTKRK